jgi:Protein kinase domain
VREILRRSGKTSPEAATVVLYGSLLGLAAAHARGVVHRDYKPENVLVNELGGRKLTDFGIAARSGTTPVSAGSLAYAPPEQFDGTPASPASDVYAATATFYECLAGRPPFTGESSQALMDQHRSASVPLDAVPEPLRPLIALGMAKNPAYRPADAAALATSLRAAATAAYGPDWEPRGARSLARPPCCSPRCGRRAAHPPAGRLPGQPADRRCQPVGADADRYPRAGLGQAEFFVQYLNSGAATGQLTCANSAAQKEATLTFGNGQTMTATADDCSQHPNDSAIYVGAGGTLQSYAIFADASKLGQLFTLNWPAGNLSGAVDDLRLPS